MYLLIRFPINDYHSVLYLSLLDEEDLVNDDVLGRIAIPLFNCKGLKKYILKDPKLTGVGKTHLVKVVVSVFHDNFTRFLSFIPLICSQI